MLRTNKSKLFKSTEYTSKFPMNLYSLLKNQECCDLVVVAGVDKVEVPAHRIILMSASDWFMQMFHQQLEETKTGVVNVESMDGLTLNFLLQLFYTGSAELNSENVENVLKAANFLQMGELLNACWNFLHTEMDSNNCLGFGLLANLYPCPMMVKEARLFANISFEEVCTTEEFMQLNVAQVTELVNGDFKCPEHIVVTSLVAWVKYDQPNRQEHIFNILKSRLGFLLNNRFKKLAYIKTKEWCLKTFNRDTKKWNRENIPPPLHKRTKYAVTGANKNVILIGGMIDGAPTNKVECLDIRERSWTELPPMSVARVAPEVCALDGNLYVVGGYNEDLLTSMEIYNFSTQTWGDVLNLVFSPKRMAVANGVLYATSVNSNKIESYDIAEKKLKQLECKVQTSNDLEIAVVSGKLYVASECVYYDLLKHNWYRIDFLGSGTADITKCLELEKRLVICRRERNSHFVYEFDPSVSKWNELSSFVENIKDEIIYFSI